MFQDNLNDEFNLPKTMTNKKDHVVSDGTEIEVRPEFNVNWIDEKI